MIQQLKTSADWYKSISTHVVINIPYGWFLHDNYQYSFNEELITLNEFEIRLGSSETISLDEYGEAITGEYKSIKGYLKREQFIKTSDNWGGNYGLHENLVLLYVELVKHHKNKYYAYIGVHGTYDGYMSIFSDITDFTHALDSFTEFNYLFEQIIVSSKEAPITKNRLTNLGFNYA